MNRRRVGQVNVEKVGVYFLPEEARNDWNVKDAACPCGCAGAIGKVRPSAAPDSQTPGLDLAGQCPPET